MKKGFHCVILLKFWGKSTAQNEVHRPSVREWTLFLMTNDERRMTRDEGRMTRDERRMTRDEGRGASCMGKKF